MFKVKEVDMGYKGCLVTLCRNEEDIIPFCIDYWKRLGINHVVVWDNESTDKSVEMLSKYDWIEVRTFKTLGQTDTVQKTLKEQTYLELKDKYDFIILCDMDEVFWFKDFNSVLDTMFSEDYDVLMTPIYSLCEESKPQYIEGKLLHELCHMFYHQRMNHMEGFDKMSKLSIFNCHTVDKISMSVGQHYVITSPKMMIMLSNDGFCLHIDKGFGEKFFIKKRIAMGANLSDENKRHGMCVEYLKSIEDLEKEYAEKQKESFDLNEIIKKS